MLGCMAMFQVHSNRGLHAQKRRNSARKRRKEQVLKNSASGWRPSHPVTGWPSPFNYYERPNFQRKFDIWYITKVKGISGSWTCWYLFVNMSNMSAIMPVKHIMILELTQIACLIYLCTINYIKHFASRSLIHNLRWFLIYSSTKVW